MHQVNILCGEEWVSLCSGEQMGWKGEAGVILVEAELSVQLYFMKKISITALQK